MSGEANDNGKALGTRQSLFLERTRIFYRRDRLGNEIYKHSYWNARTKKLGSRPLQTQVEMAELTHQGICKPCRPGPTAEKGDKYPYLDPNQTAP